MKKQAETHLPDISTVPIHYVEKHVQKLKPSMAKKKSKRKCTLDGHDQEAEKDTINKSLMSQLAEESRYYMPGSSREQLLYHFFKRGHPRIANLNYREHS